MRDPPRILWNCSGFSPLLIYKVTALFGDTPEDLSLFVWLHFSSSSIQRLNDLSRKSHVFTVGEKKNSESFCSGILGWYNPIPQNMRGWRWKWRWRRRKFKRNKWRWRWVTRAERATAKNKTHEEKKRNKQHTDPKQTCNKNHPCQLLHFFPFLLVSLVIFLHPAMLG